MISRNSFSSTLLRIMGRFSLAFYGSSYSFSSRIQLTTVVIRLIKKTNDCTKNLAPNLITEAQVYRLTKWASSLANGLHQLPVALMTTQRFTTVWRNIPTLPPVHSGFRVHSALSCYSVSCNHFFYGYLSSQFFKLEFLICTLSLAPIVTLIHNWFTSRTHRLMRIRESYRDWSRLALVCFLLLTLSKFLSTNKFNRYLNVKHKDFNRFFSRRKIWELEDLSFNLKVHFLGDWENRSTGKIHKSWSILFPLILRNYDCCINVFYLKFQ